MSGAVVRAVQMLSEVAALAGRVHLASQLGEALRETLTPFLACLAVDLGETPSTSAGLLTLHAAEADPSFPDRLRRLRTQRVLLCRGGREGVCVWIGFGVESSDQVRLTRDLTVALGRVIGALIDNVRVVERLADVSRRAYVENRLLKDEISREVDRPVAVSPAMRHAVDLMELVARETASVLLRGETGTGKEVFARRIHALSTRSARPFLKVNCGALPESLIESALFGHERGSFTGAAQRHLGFFERAQGGTLFLDEVAELPLASQVKLLRVLQEGEIERVGGSTTLRVDVRIVAATHRPLEELVSSGRFREDLYYRLNVFPIAIPPLRERTEDLPKLVESILARLCERSGSSVPGLTGPVLERLRRHRWPGNVRELENVLERSRILSRGETLRLAPNFEPVTSADAPGVVEPMSPFRDWERRGIERALKETGGRVYGRGGAAELLALKPTTLQSKIHKLKIRRAAFLVPER